MKNHDNTQPDINVRPKFKLGEMVLFEDCVVRIMGREQYAPFGMWFYLLGSKVGKSKVVWHAGCPEAQITKPCWQNVVEFGAA